jgi:hypothetical protein
MRFIFFPYGENVRIETKLEGPGGPAEALYQCLPEKSQFVARVTSELPGTGGDYPIDGIKAANGATHAPVSEREVD